MSRNGAASPSTVDAAATARRRRILVLDDEPNMQRLMRVILEGEGYDVMVTDDGIKALETLNREPFDLVIQDLRMPNMDGLTFLGKLKEAHPDILSIVVTAFGTWETAVEAMRLGAYTHLSKPFDTEQFRQLVARAMERKEIASQGPSRDDFPLLDIVGSSVSMNAVVLMVKRIAPTDTTVLISGESGTGKELIARAIHYNSLRVTGPFVPVNCGAFTETLLESELFGHVKGAFTNAVNDRKGLFETADSGTLFLDEIGEMSPLMQVKLLRVLETQSFKPVGGNRDVHVDVRIIAATNRNLQQMCMDGNFREDLFHRLNVIPIALPPLRDRPEDIPLLAGRFLAEFAKSMGKKVTGIDEGVLGNLIEYSWPGNVRELENTIERAVALCGGERIREEDIVGPMAASTTASGKLHVAQLAAGIVKSPPRTPVPGQAPAPPVFAKPEIASAPEGTTAADSGVKPAIGAVKLPEGGMDLERYLFEQERAFIVQALERTDWNMTEAAKLLGMTFRSMRYRVSKLNIERPKR